MPFDDEDEDEPGAPGLPLPPDDRLWRHPSEVGRSIGTHSPRPRIMTLAAAAVGGAAVALAALTLAGNLDDSPEQVDAAVERVALPAFGTVPVVASGSEDTAPRAQPGLVTVESGDEARGTGVVLRSDGHVVTAASLVGDAARVVVVAADGERGGASVIGHDSVTGLAVLAVTWLDGRPTAVVGTEESLAIGDRIATATARGDTTSGLVSDLSATAGSTDSPRHGLVRTTGRLHPEGVGGPVLDTGGNVVGIALWSDPSPATWSVPIGLARRVADAIITEGRVRHSWLGVEGTDGDSGPVLKDVATDSPAARAGLEPGDVLTQVDGTPVAAMADVLLVLREHRPGDRVRIDYRRGTDDLSCTAELVERAI